ncbi:uncharacterized protein ALTATR162_LOCUS3034 [Alternaria atra]|uniref:Uncharacterized protein n=1 Tax=Alternaria atra TaxID=119953 RepID=A0A8J2HZF9_9PLEO|nr:uncharacterized protein ALTATR162_LOCUS3034 [Alternaria atra]CAG5153097.1 unnamed protein product [Alternaria atra]
MWFFDAQRQMNYQFDAQNHRYIYADGLIVPQPGYSKPPVIPPAHRGYDQPIYPSRAPPPPPPNNYPDLQSSQPVNQGHFFQSGQPPGNFSPPPPPPPSPPPPDYHLDRSSYMPALSRPPDSGYLSINPRYVQALPSLSYGQLAYPQHPPPPPHTYSATGAYSNGGSGDDQNDRNRHGRNHFEDNNPPAKGDQPNGRDRIDDGDETQAMPRYYKVRDGG